MPINSGLGLLLECKTRNVTCLNIVLAYLCFTTLSVRHNVSLWLSFSFLLFSVFKFFNYFMQMCVNDGPFWPHSFLSPLPLPIRSPPAFTSLLGHWASLWLPVWDGWEAAYWSMAHILLVTLLERVSLCPTSRLLFLLPHSPLPMALVVRSSSPQWLPLIPEVPTELQRPTVAEAHSLPRISPWTIFQMVREFSDSQVAFPVYIMPRRGILKTISILSKPSIYQMLPLLATVAYWLV